MMQSLILWNQLGNNIWTDLKAMQPSVMGSLGIVGGVAAVERLSGTSFSANWLHVCQKDRSR